MAGHAGFRDVRSHVPDRQFGSDDWGEDHGHSLPTERKQLLLPRSRKERRGGPEDHSRISTKGSLDQQQDHVHDHQDDSARVRSSELPRSKPILPRWQPLIPRRQPMLPRYMPSSRPSSSRCCSTCRTLQLPRVRDFRLRPCLRP